MPLTPRQQRFVEEYLVDLNATQAAIRAGYSAKTATSQGERLLRNVEVSAAIQAAQKARSERTKVTVDQVLLRLWSIATADANELIEFRRTCCRNCHGAKHGYQRTAGEMVRDRKIYETTKAKRKPDEPILAPFDELGGLGYDATRPPHPKCPECFGEGIGTAFPKDTRSLSAQARCLYAGVKVTKEGLEVKMHDQHSALVDVAKHLGMFVDRHEHTGPNGQPIEHEHRISVTERIEQLAAAFAAAARRSLPGPGGVPGDGS